MPFTAYHFGPSGFLGLVFRRWIDLPVFLLANVVVDIEVLIIGVLELGRPCHRYCHTLLIGAAVGAVWGIVAYRLRSFFKKIMQFLRMPYKTSLWKMVVSGVLGVWLHVLIDGIYHYDVQVFWPNKKISLWRIVRRHIGYDRMGAVAEGIEIACVVLLLAAVTLYVLIINRSSEKQE